MPPLPNYSIPVQVPVPVPVIHDIILLPHQIETYNKIHNTMKTNMSILLAAPTGSGKTIVGIKLGKDYDMGLFVVGPASIEENWLDEAAKYGIKIIFISYTRLGGRGGKFSHPYLNNINGTFYASDEFKKVVQMRTLLIFDECQAAKKTTAVCSKACYALSRAVRNMNCGSRIMLASGTPFDKEEFAESTFKLMAIIQQDLLFEWRVADREFVLEGFGFEEAIAYCNKINPELTRRLYPENLNAKAIRKSLYDMFIHIIKTRAVFTMPRPIITAKFIPESHYYRLEDFERDSVLKAIKSLGSAVRPNGEAGAIQITGGNMGRITTALVALERAKIHIFERIIRKILTTTVNDKVIVYLWYDEGVEYLMNVFKQYNPLRCDGKVVPKKRAAHVKLFQQPNNMYRLIIAKPTAFSVGINLDDRDGHFPRHTFINPSYHFDKIHQAAGRTYRATTKSDARCTLCYVKDTEEGSIIEALRKKSDVVLDIVSFNDETENDDEMEEENATIFPADYPKVIDQD